MFQKAINETPNCSACGTPMKLIPAGVSKTKVDDEGNPVKYGAFWSCPQNRSCGGKTIKYTEPTPKAPQKPYNKPVEADIPIVKESPRDAIMVDLLNEINGKLDSLNRDVEIIINEIVPKVE